MCAGTLAVSAIESAAKICFVFSSRRRHTRFSRDWSSDVCSSDLLIGAIFISATSKRGKCIRVRRTSRSVLIIRCLDVDVAMEAAGLLLGADNTTLEVTFGSNFCARPQNCVFDDGVVAHAAIGADRKKSGQLRARSYDGTLCHTNRPLRLLDITGSPTVRDHTMDFQVLS